MLSLRKGRYAVREASSEEDLRAAKSLRALAFLPHRPGGVDAGRPITKIPTHLTRSAVMFWSKISRPARWSAVSACCR